MPRFRFVKMSKDWTVTGPISDKTLMDRMSGRAISGVGVSGEQKDVVTIELADKAMIVLAAKADGADIGLVEF